MKPSRSDSAREAVLRQILGEEGPLTVSAPSGACPDEDLLVGLAVGNLLKGERESLLGHVAACDVCCSLVVEAFEASAASPAVQERQVRRERPAGRRLWIQFLAPVAAAALLVLGILILLPGEGVRSTDEVLVAEARELAAAAPDLFTTFRPLSHNERIDVRAPVARGGLTLLAPVRSVLEGRPTFRWEPVPGAETYAFRLRSQEDGSVLFETSTAEATLPWPEGREALAPGSAWIWSITVRDAFGQDEGLLAFEVADADARKAMASRFEAIDRHAEPRVALLLEAHVALRAGFLGEAERAARAYLAAHPGDDAGRETLFHVLTLLGASEAAHFKTAPRTEGD